jgi:hypothetical protein
VNTTEYLFVGEHADTLASGRHVAPGDSVPADAVDLDDQHDCNLVDEGRLVPISPPEPSAYEKQSADELQAEAERRGLEVDGTGADGNVLKKDLVAALEAHDIDPELKEGK